MLIEGTNIPMISQSKSYLMLLDDDGNLTGMLSLVDVKHFLKK
jgi:hypothetical protein